MTPVQYLYPVYDRASYEAAFGKQPPAFDATRAVKRWFTADAVTSFRCVQVGTDDGTAPLNLDAATAAAVNIPGPYRYDPTPWNGALSNDDIIALAGLIGGTVQEAHSVGIAPDASWPVITAGGYTQVAGVLVAQWYAAGKNRIGHWHLVNGHLILDPAPEQPVDGVTPKAEIPQPLKPLLPGQKIVRAGVMNTLWIQDPTDITSPAGGSFTDSDRALLYAIYSILQGGVK
jgi:hypothetical protein